MYYIIIIAIIACDQGIKYGVRTCMDLHQSIPVIADFFHLTYIQNRGAAFSLMEGASWLLVLFPAAMIIAALIYLVIGGKKRAPMCRLSLSFIVAGGVGNLIDRLYLGYVVDYLDFGSFPVFNLADIFICCGCFLLALYVLFFESKSKDKKQG